jgi:hypothetical protein
VAENTTWVKVVTPSPVALGLADRVVVYEVKVSPGRGLTHVPPSTSGSGVGGVVGCTVGVEADAVASGDVTPGVGSDGESVVGGRMVGATALHAANTTAVRTTILLIANGARMVASSGAPGARGVQLGCE